MALSAARQPLRAVFLAIPVAAWSLLSLTPAAAQHDSRRTDAKAEARATEHVRKAAEAFRAGRYEEATTEFQAGYAIVPRPAFILNMAHAQRQAGNLARARAYYKQFLELEPLSSQRADVEKAIAEIDAASATAGTAPPTSPVAPPPAARASVSLAVAGDDSEVPGDLKMAAREPIQKRDDGGPSFYQQWWFWGTVAGVVAAGVVAFLVVRSSGDDYTTAGTLGTLGR